MARFTYSKTTKWLMTGALKKRILERIRAEIKAAESNNSNFDCWMIAVEACEAEGTVHPWTTAAGILAEQVRVVDEKDPTCRYVASQAIEALAYELQIMRQERKELASALKTVAGPMRGRDTKREKSA